MLMCTVICNVYMHPQHTVYTHTYIYTPDKLTNTLIHPINCHTYRHTNINTCIYEHMHLPLPEAFT